MARRRVSICKEVFAMWKPFIGTALLGLLLASPALAVDLDDVVRMLEAGVGEEIVLKVIDADRTEFVLTSEDLIDLTEAGASDWLLKELLDRSAEPQRVVEPSYRVIEPSYGMITLGYVYDPFDYYFVTWPYYYAYYSPFRFSWNWWYYGGPVHHHWCDPWGQRVDYYDGRWGARTIWDRGWRGDARYHVPRYDDGAKETVRHAGGRSVGYHSPGVRTQQGGLRSRGERDEKPTRSGVIEPGRGGDRPVRAPAWGRPERRSESPSRPARTPRSEVRTPAPPHSSPPAGSRGEIRQSPPPRGSAPSRSASRSPSSPSRPAAPPRRGGSR
jgi:hypothetical protein